MPIAQDLHQLSSRLFLWHAYDKSVKADLFSSALLTKNGLFLVDPIEIASAALEPLTGSGRIAGVIVTNGNHFRSADVYIRQYSVPLFAHRNSLPNEPPPSFIEVNDGSRIGEEIKATVIEGAGPGEVAIYHAADNGTLVMGDALINFDPHGFTFLPNKYCENPKQMRKSLRSLLRYDAERILFAHGMPILSGATTRLSHLLNAHL